MLFVQARAGGVALMVLNRGALVGDVGSRGEGGILSELGMFAIVTRRALPGVGLRARLVMLLICSLIVLYSLFLSTSNWAKSSGTQAAGDARKVSS